MFKSCKPIIDSRFDIDNFASSLAGILDGIIQYNNEYGPKYYNVDKICKKMLSTSDHLQNFVDINTVGINIDECLGWSDVIGPPVTSQGNLVAS